MKSTWFGRAASVLALVLIGASSLDAQYVNGRWQISPQTSHGPSTSRGIQAPPPQRDVVVYPSPMATIPWSPRIIVPLQPIAYTLIPAIVMSDGSIWANFGYGYEPVRRSCANAVVTGQPRVVDGSGNVLSESSQTMVLSAASQSACYRRDAYGRVTVLR